MTREEFKTVVKCFSKWKVDKRRGNYRLPNGRMLRGYLDELVAELLRNNSLGFGSNGNIYDVIQSSDGVYDVIQSSDGLTMIVPFGDNEPIIKSEQKYRVQKFVDELIN